MIKNKNLTIKSKKANKEKQIEAIKKIINGLSTLLIISYSGLKVRELEKFKTLLNKEKAKISFFKNSLVKIGMKEEKWKNLFPVLKGKIFFVHNQEASLATIKTVYQFLTKFEKTKIKLGFFAEKFLTGEEVKEIALLPSQEQLLIRMINLLKMGGRALILTLQAKSKKAAKI